MSSPFDKFAQNIRQTFDPHHVQQAFQGVPGEIQKPLTDAINHIQQLVNEAGQQLHNAGDEIKKGLYDVQGEVATNIRGEAQKALSAVDTEIHKIWHTLVEDAKKDASKRILQALLDTVKKAPISSVRFQLSIVCFNIDQSWRQGCGNRSGSE